MKKGIGILMAVLFLGTAFGQDEKAKAVLDRVSAKTNAYKSIIIDFELTISGGDEIISEKGKAFLEGDKYKIELPDQHIYCDGITIATHLIKDKECYVSSVADAAEDNSIISPTEILTIWEKGYKYKYIKETTYKGKNVHHINLFPKDAAKSKFFAIILKIDKEKDEVVSVLVKGKEGSKMRYDLTKFQKNVSIPAATFVFNKAKHPEVDFIEE